jgi:glutamate synthase domain-containing protein 2/CDGSH-type Zn-finger protein
MSAPKIAEIKPIATKLESGEDYHWCSCGRSGNQPFCDGSHRGSEFTPLAFSPDEDTTAYLCQCKHTSTPPYCDGSHKRFTANDLGAEVEVAREGALEATPTPEEPTVAYIHELARNGLKNVGEHGPMGAMGVPRSELPSWDDIQLLTAQLATKPLLDDVPVQSELVIGPRAKKPLHLAIPLFVSDMSYGALSEEAKVALASGAELAGTGICSGEGGMLPEEQNANSRYFYELASARFGFRDELMSKVQAFHFKGGQGAKTGTGGHLPASKVIGKIAQVRGLVERTDAVSPATFADLNSSSDFREFADHVRDLSGGIPIGFKLSANHIEADIDFALEASADYIILDGRGGGTGAAPLIFRDNISVPTIPALARARQHLQRVGHEEVTLIITGGLRTPADFVKALCLGADGIAISNSAMQAIGCIAARMCNTNNCPVGIATQKPELRKRMSIRVGADRLHNFLSASVSLMKVLARACGHDHLQQFNQDDITSWSRDMAELSGIQFAGPGKG